MISRKHLILVVDDEPPIVRLVKAKLRLDGYEVITASRGDEALGILEEETPDLIVLDVMMPDMDGFETLRRIRQHSQVPVVMLTARGSDADKLQGLKSGADDYITKPFSLEELLLRVQAVLRRGRAAAPATSRLTCGDVTLDEDAMRVWRGETEVALSPTEFRLLRYLMLNRDRVVSRQQILDHVWDYDFAGDPNAVETYISYLRRKLDDRDARLIHTVRGFGYSLRAPGA